MADRNDQVRFRTMPFHGKPEANPIRQIDKISRHEQLQHQSAAISLLILTFIGFLENFVNLLPETAR